MWEPLVGRFVDDHYGTLRGRVRTHVINEHLLHHLATPPLRVVDVGGGAGNQSIPLARLGYEVTIVDPSPAMLDRARQRVAAEEREVQTRISLVEASGEVASDALGGAVFGGVLCHGVIPYLDDPAEMVTALCQLAGPDGVVSIVAKNVEVLALFHANVGDWASTIAAFDAVRQVNGLGVETRGDRVDHLSGLLAGNGVEPIAWYGVRLFTDAWRSDRPSTDPEELVLEAELLASQRDPYRRLSRLFHLVGQRRALV